MLTTPVVILFITTKFRELHLEGQHIDLGELEADPEVELGAGPEYLEAGIVDEVHEVELLEAGVVGGVSAHVGVAVAVLQEHDVHHRHARVEDEAGVVTARTHKRGHLGDTILDISNI